MRRIGLQTLCVALCALVLAPATAGAITRETTLQRAEQWIKVKVPYSQSAYATSAGVKASGSTTGWRTDCSGFVSMCWGLRTSSGAPRSLDTATLPSVATKLSSKSSLKAGDIILRPKNTKVNGKTVPYGHAIIFVRWVDSAKTRYIGYHESSSQKGAVANEIAYPFWGDPGYAPYRYKSIQDGRLRKSRTWLGALTMSTSAVPPVGSSVSTLAIPSVGATPLVPETW